MRNVFAEKWRKSKYTDEHKNTKFTLRDPQKPDSQFSPIS